eukprot:scaffold56832_cov45-Attheya_sp.AAC.5
MEAMMANAAGGAAPPPAPDNGKKVDLLDKVEKAGCYARNESSAFPMTNLFIGDDRLGCKSDADEQLILHISFMEFVKKMPKFPYSTTPMNREMTL